MTAQTTTSIAELQQKAQAGDAQAQFDLALCYANGDGVEKDEVVAFDWHKQAAELGHADAQFALGLFYFIGGAELQPIFNKWVAERFTNKNFNPAFDLAVSQVLSTKLTQTDHDLAFKWLKIAAEKNYSEAQYYLALCYLEGKSVEQNHDIAFEWFEKAAKDNIIEAQDKLARCYRDGNGVGKNESLAFEWFKKAADADFAEAQLELGRFYTQGIGVEKNARLAFEYLKKAAEQDIAEAQYCLAQAYEHGAIVEEDLKLAVEWYEKAAENKVSEAQYRLAKLFLEGNGVEKNYSIGMNWLKRAIEANSSSAYEWLENTYLNFVFPYFSDREDIEQCYQFGYEWLTQRIADNPSDYEVNFCLGVLYAFGKGVEKNQPKSIQHFDACMRVCDLINESFTEIFYNFSDFFIDICSGNNKNYYIEYLAPFFANESQVDMAAKEATTVLPLLRIDFHLWKKEFELLKEFLNRFEHGGSIFNHSSSKSSFRIMGLTVTSQAETLEQKNKALEEERNRLDEANHRMQKLVEQFTHTLGNVIFPDTIYQVAERLKTNPDCRKDVLLLNEAYHSEIIIKLQGELLRQRYANTNPERFRQLIRACRRDLNSQDKSKSIADILDYAASRVTARFLNQHNASLGSIRDKILTQKNISLDVLRQQFEDDILLNKTLGSVEWINQYLRPFEVVALSPLWQKVYILAESHAEALLFGYFSEVLFNAFKYADHDAEKFLTVRFDETVIEGKTYLSCSWSNPMGNKTPNSLGTGKGLDAILEDLRQLNDTNNATNSLLVTQDDDQFKVTLFFQKHLLINDAPKPPKFPR